MLIRRRFFICSLLAFALILLTVPSVGSAFRDNDQAALFSGEFQFMRGQMSPFDSIFYNYDKQWGTYALLTGLSWLAPGSTWHRVEALM